MEACMRDVGVRVLVRDTCVRVCTLCSRLVFSAAEYEDMFSLTRDRGYMQRVKNPARSELCFWCQVRLPAACPAVKVYHPQEERLHKAVRFV
eukprot:626347-Rhodomonas_salina.1